MSAQRSFNVMLLRCLAIAGIWASLGFSIPVLTQAADPASETNKEGSGRAEQSPEEAAGGRLNMMHIKKACEEDIKKLCPQIRPGGGRILQCLHGQPSNLSPACRQVLEPRSSNP